MGPIQPDRVQEPNPQDAGWVWDWIGLAALATNLYPLLVMLLIHGAYAAAWIDLGHRPTMVDNASSMPTEAFQILAYYAMVGVFGAFPAGVILVLGFSIRQLIRRTSGIQEAAIIWAVALLLWGGSWAFMSWDPAGAVNWFFD